MYMNNCDCVLADSLVAPLQRDISASLIMAKQHDGSFLPLRENNLPPRQDLAI